MLHTPCLSLRQGILSGPCCCNHQRRLKEGILRPTAADVAARRHDCTATAGTTRASLSGGRRRVVPGQVGVVAQLPWLDHVCHGKHNTQEDADAADNEVGNAKEGVSAAHDGTRRQDDGLCAVEPRDVED